MLLPVNESLTEEELEEVRSIAAEFQVEVRAIQGKVRTIYALIGDERPSLLTARLEGLPYVERLEHIQEPYKLLSMQSKDYFRPWEVNGKTVGRDFIVAAGQCTIDPANPNLFLETAHAVKESGADLIRGGVWKPRTSPYSYQGDARALEILLRAREETGLGIVTEVMDDEHVELCVRHKVDCFQVGTRNALNYRLLATIGEATRGTGIRVLLKRSLHMGKVDEFLCAAEYIVGNGNPNVLLCPRGSVPTMDGYRNHPDESITQLLKEKTWAPVVVDPSHSVGKSKYVPKAALAAAAYGADGVILETHCRPVQGIGDDPKQAITPEVLAKLIPELRAVAMAAKKFGPGAK